MTKAELKPCPFHTEAEAGDKIPAVMTYKVHGGWEAFVCCLHCDARGPIIRGNRKEAVFRVAEDAWNHRPTEQALIEALKMWKSRIAGPTDHTMQDVLNATDQALEMAGA